MKAAVVRVFGQPPTIAEVPVPLPGPGPIHGKTAAAGGAPYRSSSGGRRLAGQAVRVERRSAPAKLRLTVEPETADGSVVRICFQAEKLDHSRAFQGPASYSRRTLGCSIPGFVRPTDRFEWEMTLGV